MEYLLFNGVVILSTLASWRQAQITLADRVTSASDLSTLGALLAAANIDLSIPGTFTLLAPTNAFAALPRTTVTF
jgi:uncharacterized surface protein with fasciclin (FAS1) repeats